MGAKVLLAQHLSCRHTRMYLYLGMVNVLAAHQRLIPRSAAPLLQGPRKGRRRQDRAARSRDRWPAPFLLVDLRHPCPISPTPLPPDPARNAARVALPVTGSQRRPAGTRE